MSYVLGVDVGGTFTDFVAYDTLTGSVSVWKDFSSPGDPGEGILRGLKQFANTKEIVSIRLGTTIATNAILERKGAVIAYITSKGFKDVPFIQRGNRRFHFNARWIKPQPLVAREHCFEISERMDCDGNVLKPLNEDDVLAVVREIRRVGHVEAIAINLLFSYINPAHEMRVREILTQELPHIPVSASFDVLPKWKEYERASTTIADAYVKPIISRQLPELERKINGDMPDAQLVVTKSNGGQVNVAGACASPVQMTLSGPTGGVIAAQYIAHQIGEPNFVTLDMGGTSTDCALGVNGKVPLTTNFEIEWGIPIQVPMVDVRTVGAGGGSIAWVDKGGMLRVGPQSAGSKPGPVCYGRGGVQTTVTDANLIAGRINPDNFLGGTVKLDVVAARKAMSSLADTLGLSVDETAMAIIKIVNNHMVGAVRSVLTERGEDTSRFALMCFGGAGPVHACDLLQSLDMEKAIIPIHPGQFSAFGFIATDARVDRQRTVQMTSNRMDVRRANEVLRTLESECVAQLEEQGGDAAIRVSRQLDMRYHGQNYELSLPFDSGEFNTKTLAQLWVDFNAAHNERFGFNIPGEVIELVNFSITGVQETAKPRIPPRESSTLAPIPIQYRSVMFDSGRQHTPIFRREDLMASQTILGPAVIEEDVSVLCVNPGQRVRMDGFANLIITTVQQE